MSTPRILIIGSGAVGAIYGAYLAQAGCHTAFLVRDRASINSRMPRTLHHYSMLGALSKRIRTDQQNLRVIDQAHTGWDQVWICLPSNAIHTDWLSSQLAKVDPKTPIILWSPDFRDQQRLAAMHKGPVSRALIGLASFQTPLPGELSPSAGIAYLTPPRSAVLENSDAGKQAAQWLRQGGLPAINMDKLSAHEALMTAQLQPLIAALECCDWSLATLRKSALLTTACEAANEAARIGSHFLDPSSPAAHKTHSLPGRRWLFKLAIFAAPVLSPFPLQTYLHYHFAKVGEQTRQMLDGWIDYGQKNNLPTSALAALRQALPPIASVKPNTTI